MDKLIHQWKEVLNKEREKTQNLKSGSKVQKSKKKEPGKREKSAPKKRKKGKRKEKKSRSRQKDKSFENTVVKHQSIQDKICDDSVSFEQNNNNFQSSSYIMETRKVKLFQSEPSQMDKKSQLVEKLVMAILDITEVEKFSKKKKFSIIKNMLDSLYEPCISLIDELEEKLKKKDDIKIFDSNFENALKEEKLKEHHKHESNQLKNMIKTLENEINVQKGTINTLQKQLIINQQM